MREINQLVVHCSDTPDNVEFDASDIHRWHLERSWDGIGYHEVIKRDGRMDAGRPWYWVGSHAFGHNGDSMSVCLIGREDYTDEQIDSLVRLLVEWRVRWQNAVIVGHYELDPGKTCPNIDMHLIRDKVDEQLQSFSLD